MDPDKYAETLLHVAAALTTACIGDNGSTAVNVVMKFREVVAELQKGHLLDNPKR